MLALCGPPLCVSSHLLVIFLACITTLNSSWDESDYLLKILIAIQTTAAIPPEDDTSFLSMLFLPPLVNSHMSVDIFPQYILSYTLRLFISELGSTTRTVGACLLLLCFLSGNVFQITVDCWVLKAFSCQNDSTSLWLQSLVLNYSVFCTHPTALCLLRNHDSLQSCHCSLWSSALG